MTTYVMLMKMTTEGLKDVRHLPQRVKEGMHVREALGGKLLHFYTVMGEYDFVAVCQFPDDRVMMSFLLRLGSQGHIMTTTLKAFEEEEVEDIIRQI